MKQIAARGVRAALLVLLLSELLWTLPWQPSAAGSCACYKNRCEQYESTVLWRRCQGLFNQNSSDHVRVQVIHSMRDLAAYYGDSHVYWLTVLDMLVMTKFHWLKPPLAALWPQAWQVPGMNELQEDLQLLQAGLPVLHPIHDTPQAEQQLPNRYIACTKSASIPNPGQIPGQADSGSSTEPVPAIKCTEFLQQDRSQHGTASDQKLRSFVIYPQAMQLAPHQHAYAADNLGFASHSPDETPRFTEGSCFDLGPGLLLQPCIRRGLHWMATVAMPAVAQRLPSVQLKLWTAAAKGGHPGSQWWLWRLPGGGLCSIYRAAPLLDADLPWLVRMLYVLVLLEAAHTCVILLQLAAAAPWALQIFKAIPSSLRLWWRVLRDQPFKFGIFSFSIFAPGRSIPQRSRVVSTTDAQPSVQLPPHARAAFCILHQFVGECCVMLALFLHACRFLPWLLVPLGCISCAAHVSKSLPVWSTVLTVLGPGIIVVAMAVAGLAAWYRAASILKDALMFIQGEPIYLEAWLWPIREDLNPHCSYKWLEPRKMLFEVSLRCQAYWADQDSVHPQHSQGSDDFDDDCCDRLHGKDHFPDPLPGQKHDWDADDFQDTLDSRGCSVAGAGYDGGDGGDWPEPLDVPDAVYTQLEGEVPRGFICPLTERIMRQPALLLHSRVRGTRKRAISYEYEAIMTWLTEHRTDPLNDRVKLHDVRLLYNHSLAVSIDDWVGTRAAASTRPQQQQQHLQQQGQEQQDPQQQQEQQQEQLQPPRRRSQQQHKAADSQQRFSMSLRPRPHRQQQQ